MILGERGPKGSPIGLFRLIALANLSMVPQKDLVKTALVSMQ